MKLKIIDHHAELHLVVKPNARKTAFTTINEKGLTITLQAKPDKGEANKELIAYLARTLKIPKSRIILKKGGNSRYKTVLIPLTQEVQNYFDKL